MMPFDRQISAFNEHKMMSGWHSNTGILMLWAAFDESGDHDLKSGQLTQLTIGGVVAVFDEWCGFIEEWATALKDEGVTTFHATDVQNFRGEFAKENKWNEARRRVFIGKLVEILDKYALSFVGARIPVYQGSVRIAYENGFLQSIGNVLIILRVLLKGERIALKFAQHSEVSENLLPEVAMRLAQGYPEIQSCSIDRPEDVLPLQAADLIAYELRKWPGRETDQNSWRYPMRRLWGDGRPGRFFLYP